MHVSLVTGGAGFIGAHVTNELLQNDHQVVVLDDLSGGFQDNVPSGAEFIEGSVNDTELVKGLFDRYEFDYVFHLAAYAAEGLSHFIRRFNYTNNVVGSMTILNEAVRHEVECLVFTSSIAVYGENQLPMHEDLTPQPEDPYGVAKYSVELDLQAAHEMFDLDYIVFRPHNVYGEYQNIGDRYRNVIGIFMNQLMKGEPLTIFGDGEQTRAFSYIGDVAPYIAGAVDVPEAYNEVFNVGGDTPYSVNELAETVMDVMGIDGEIKHLPARNEVKHAYADHSKAKEVFGIESEQFVSLKDGLQEMADWAKAQGARQSSKFDNIEIEKNLPSAWVNSQ
jgi:UDP-glucose 4-epimerase